MTLNYAIDNLDVGKTFNLRYEELIIKKMVMDSIKNNDIDKFLNLKQKYGDLYFKESFFNIIIHSAALHGNFEIFKILITVDDVTSGRCGHTILHSAVIGKNENIVKFILENNSCDIDALDHFNESAIYIAADRGNFTIFKMLFENKASLKCNDSYNFLHCAAESNNVEFVKFILDNKIVDVKSQDVRKQTPLHRAATIDNVEIVKILIEHGADVNALDHCDASPIFIAACHGHWEIFKILVENGAELDNLDYLNQSLIMYAITGQNTDIIKFLCESSDCLYDEDYKSRTPLYCALKHDNDEIIKVLIENGSDVHATNINGKTPLLLAAKKGNFEIFKILFENCEDVKHIDEHERNLLHYAVRGNNKDIIEFILNKKICNVNAINADGDTPIVHAVENGYVEIFNILVKHGADLMCKNGYGDNLLISAISSGNVKMVKMILDMKLFDINGCDRYAPIHMASFKNLEIINILIEYGADINIKDEIGRNALQLAIWNGKLNIVEFFFNKGMRINNSSIENELLCKNIARYRVDLLKMLINNGFDLLYRDKNGTSAICKTIKEFNIFTDEFEEDGYIDEKITILDIYRNISCSRSCDHDDCNKFFK